MLKYRMPLDGDGTRSKPLRPKYPVGPRETRDIPWIYEPENGTVVVFVDDGEPPEFAANPDVEFIGQGETVEPIPSPFPPLEPLPQ